MSGVATEIVVTARGRATFDVTVRTGGGSTTHEVVVPTGLADALGWSAATEADLVRESFVFLLEREPSSSILRQFSLDLIGRYFPEYSEEIRRAGHARLCP